MGNGTAVLCIESVPVNLGGADGSAIAAFLAANPGLLICDLRSLVVEAPSLDQTTDFVSPPTSRIQW